MTDKPKRPNLFDFATSELSQDALLCWLLSWADGKYAPDNKPLHETAVKFVQSIIKKHNPPAFLEQSFSIEIKKQYKNADILAIIEQANKKYAILIEDKTDTIMHGDQLKRYKEIIKGDFPDHKLLPVYLKTGAISQASTAQKEDYQVYTRKDLLAVLDEGKSEIRNSIFEDFYDYLKEKHNCYEAFKIKRVDEWEWKAWEGFYSALQEKMKEEHETEIDWCYAPNPAGGELVAFWAYQKIFGDGYAVYLEIHKKSGDEGRHFLAFKANEVVDKDKRAEIRQHLHECLMQSAEKHGWGDVVRKPERFGSGKSMVFCETGDKTGKQDCWLVQDANSMIDMEKTIEKLKKAEEILRDAVRASVLGEG